MITSNPLAGARAGGTVGKPLPGVDVRVVDEAGDAVAPGAIGGVQVRGPNVFAGYWRMPEKTREEFTADGFFRTGDVGQWAPDGPGRGYLQLVGRAKDLIISGGLNVYPKEIEERIDAMDGVEESAVVGMPDPDFGEAVAAVIVGKPGHRADRGRRDRRAEGRDRELQGAQARVLRGRAAAQRDGQGAEEGAPRADRGALNGRPPGTRGRRPRASVPFRRPRAARGCPPPPPCGRAPSPTIGQHSRMASASVDDRADQRVATRRSDTSPADSSIDWRNAVSAMSPSTSASTSGASGYLSFLNR